MPSDDLPLWGNLSIFTAAAVVVFLAGSRLADFADEIAERTRFSRVVPGMVLLGIATSLPQIATTATAP